MVTVRPFRVTDITAIDDIYKRQPELGVPSLRNVIINRVVEVNGKVIGYGVVKKFAEGVLILDQTQPKRVKAEAIRELMDLSINACIAHESEQYYITTSYEGFAHVLENSFGFKKCVNPFYLLNL